MSAKHPVGIIDHAFFNCERYFHLFFVGDVIEGDICAVSVGVAQRVGENDGGRFLPGDGRIRLMAVERQRHAHKSGVGRGHSIDDKGDALVVNDEFLALFPFGKWLWRHRIKHHCFGRPHLGALLPYVGLSDFRGTFHARETRLQSGGDNDEDVDSVEQH